MTQDNPLIHHSWYQSITDTVWFPLMDPEEQGMTLQSIELYEREKDLQSNFHDYAFLVFPLAKAYEGFLKKFLLQSTLISEQTFLSRKFRIGRALNPDVPQRQRDEDWVYDDVVNRFGEDTAKLIWKAWVDGRNLLFHSFPDHRHLLSLQGAHDRMLLIISAMDSAVKML